MVNGLLVAALLCISSVGNAQILAWQFGSPASLGSEATYAATTVAANVNPSNLSRGIGVTATALARAFSANAWDASATEGGAITNNEYFQFTVSASVGFQVSLSTIDCRLRRTSTGPNAYQWRYSLDGTNFTDIGSDVVFTSTLDGVDQAQVVVSGIPALQNVAAGTTITIRVYAWGASAATGTFAFGRYGTGNTTNSLAIGGTVSSAGGCGITVGTPSTACDALTPGVDTYDLSIPYTGVSPGTTVQNNGVSGTVNGSNPAVTSNGTIVISNINEGDAYNVTFTGPCSTLPAVSGFSPSCAPPTCGITLGSESAACVTFTPGSLDTYNLSIPYTGVQGGITVVNNSGSGTVAGDDPASFSNGTILINGISEANAYSVTFTTPCAALTVAGSAPTCEPPPTTTIVINEVDSDTPGSDLAEFVELFGPANESLTGMVLVFYNGSNDLSYFAQDLDGFTLDATGFFVAGNPGVPNVDVTFAPGGTGLLQNGADAVAIYFGNGGDFPNGTPLTLTGLIDAVVYDTDDADDAGLLALLNAAQPQLNENANVAGSTQSNSRVPDGGTQRNTNTYVQQFVTPGTTNVPPCGIVPGTAVVQCTSFNPGPGDTYSLSIPYAGVQAGITVVNNSGSGTVGGSDPATVPNGTITVTGISDANNYSITFTAPCSSVIVSGNAPTCEPLPAIVINEVDYDQPGADTEEFIELKNNGLTAIDLAGYTVQLINGVGPAIYQSYVLPTFSLAPGGYYVICTVGSVVPNCNLQVPLTAGGTIQNGAPDAVAVRDATSNLLDVVSYEGNTGAPYTETSGASLLDPGALTDTNLSISRFPDGADTQNNDDDFSTNCATPGTANVVVDTDNDGTQDCVDDCPGGPEPGTICDDLNANTGNDVIQGNCVCAGIPVDCLGVPGGTATIGSICDDNNVNTVNDVYGLDCVCAGETVDCQGTPGGPALPGTPCPSDGNPNTVFDTWDANCICVGTACTTDLTLELETDDDGDEITWEIRQQGTNLLVQSGPAVNYPDNATLTDFTCLIDGCYYLRVLDSGNDGIAGGGYILRTSGSPGVRIIDNRDNFTTGGVSAISGDQGFCLPLGATNAIYTSCDKLDWVTGEYLVCSAVPAVSALWNAGNLPAEATSGYEFQIFNPNGGYIFNRFRSHNVSDGFAPDNATRACHMKINNWALAQQIPANVLMNVRVRTRINGANGNWGAACRFKIDPVRAACPLTKLMDIPGNANLSCNQTRAFVNGQYIHARPVTGATQYQWRFRIDAESFITIRTTTTYFIQLNWVTLPLQNGKTYQVEVRAFKGGAWCIDAATPAFCGFATPCFVQWGNVCDLTIDNTPANGGNENMLGDDQSGRSEGLSMYPNPNRGDQLYLNLDALEAGVETVSVDIFDLTGQRVSTRTIAVQDGFVNTVLDLDGDMANGIYLVHITAGKQHFTERLVIQK